MIGVFRSTNRIAELIINCRGVAAGQVRMLALVRASAAWISRHRSSLHSSVRSRIPAKVWRDRAFCVAPPHPSHACRVETALNVSQFGRRGGPSVCVDPPANGLLKLIRACRCRTGPGRFDRLLQGQIVLGRGTDHAGNPAGTATVSGTSETATDRRAARGFFSCHRPGRFRRADSGPLPWTPTSRFCADAGDP